MISISREERVLSSSVAGQFRATRVPKIGFQLNQRLLTTKVALWRAQYDEYTVYTNVGHFFTSGKF
jgi:hypothetical protein